jgi:SAM-dependent methyltransferase
MEIERPSHPGIYDAIGEGYRSCRIPDPRIASQIAAALGQGETVCNVGAGSGSYEPPDRRVTAVEPSLRMIGQRSSNAGVVRSRAERLPFADGTFDAAMAVLTVHHWVEPERGLAEMRRVSRRQVVLAFDNSLVDSLWLVSDYLPEIAALEGGRSLSIDSIGEMLRADRIETVTVPWDCTDGFQAAYWRRPEKYLETRVQSAISSFAQLPTDRVRAALARLAQDH